MENISILEIIAWVLVGVALGWICLSFILPEENTDKLEVCEEKFERLAVEDQNMRVFIYKLSMQTDLPLCLDLLKNRTKEKTVCRENNSSQPRLMICGGTNTNWDCKQV